MQMLYWRASTRFVQTEGGKVMAQFTEVMRQAKRMCETQKNCRQCPLCRDGECALDYLLGVDIDEIEQTIIAWAKEHPDNDSNVAHSMKTATAIAVELNGANQRQTLA